MEVSQLSARTVKGFSDIALIMIFVQIVCFMPALIRGIGFNIKQFDFEKDLQELDITEEDREEVEIGFGYDLEKSKRRLRKKIRHIKYGYLENKIFANAAILVIALLAGYFIYTKLEFNQKIFNQGEYFNTTNFNMVIHDSYITNKDYKQKQLKQGKTLIVLRLKIKNRYNTPVVFVSGRAELKVGRNKYYPTNEYKEELIDLGNTYDGGNITTEEKTFVLTYVVPSNYLNKKIQFHYVDQINTVKKKIETTSMKVKITPQDLRKSMTVKKYKIGDTIDFKNTIAGSGNLKIQTYDLKPEYQLPYNYCAKKGQCQMSFEYIKPNILTNYNKILLKMAYQYQNENIWTDKFSGLSNVISNFLIIKYQIDGKKKTHSLELEQVRAKKATQGNVIYIEVLEELKDAEKIDLEFKIGNQKILYTLK